MPKTCECETRFSWGFILKTFLAVLVVDLILILIVILFASIGYKQRYQSSQFSEMQPISNSIKKVDDWIGKMMTPTN